MKYILEKLLAKENLTHLEMWDTFTKIMNGELSEIQMTAFLIALRAKGVTREELFTATNILRDYAEEFPLTDENAIDVCGTGGGKYKLFNISTAVTFVVATAGVTVIKHGNRSNANKSGSSDVLQALGVNIKISKEESINKIKEGGVCFLFAPMYHPAMKYVAPVRKDLGISTIFNFLGPLANPAKVKRQLIGVFNEKLIEDYIYVLQRLGHKKAIVVHGTDGVDEFSLSSSSKYALLDNDKITINTISPESVGLKRAKIEDLEGGNPEENAKIIENILKGNDSSSKADIVAFNAGVALFVADKVSSIRDGVKMAKEILKSGKAYAKLKFLID